MCKLAEGWEGGEEGVPGLHCDVVSDELRLIEFGCLFVPMLLKDRHTMMGKVDLLRFA